MQASAKSCCCKICSAACHVKPGRFLPGEAEKVAKHFGVDLRTLFYTRLSAEDMEGVLVLLPAQYVEGPCLFLENGRCSIHEVKPYECREHWHGEDRGEPVARRARIREAWEPHRQQVEDLLVKDSGT